MRLIQFLHHSKKPWRKLLFISVLISLSVGAYFGDGQAQSESDEERVAVQVLEGRISERSIYIYDLPGLVAGDDIFLYVRGLSDNLDPIVAISDTSIDPIEARNQARQDIDQALVEGRDPLVVVPEILDQYFLAWDDDSGEGYDASLAFTIPEDGNYQLFVNSTLIKDTFGDFELTIGLNEPQVSSGTARPTGDPIAFLNREATQPRFAVDEIRGALSAEKRFTRVFLRDFEPGDTLFVFIEGLSGNYKPTIVLEDFGRKPVRSGNILGDEKQTTLAYTFNEVGRNYTLLIEGLCDTGEGEECDYRLVIGLNAAEVLSGKAELTDLKVTLEPIKVQMGIRMDQIAGVDQKAENFEVVGDLFFEWTDPALAFDPAECQCSFKLMTGDEFVAFTTDNDIPWPEFYFFNQQGNRWTQSEIVVFDLYGRSSYFERFSATLQAPDFNFRQFPFDSQEFYIRVDSLFPEEYFVYGDIPGASEIGEQLGEEEWQVTEFDTVITSVSGERSNPWSRFSFRFQAKRQLTFYIFRFFLPLLLIILVAWITFFLKDYTRRIEITTGNLLLFIAFNFTISDSLPKLGYLTLIDVILAGTFLISVIVVVLNVYLRRLEVTDKEALAAKIDRYTIWVYPIAYITLALAIYYFFFINEGFILRYAV